MFIESMASCASYYKLAHFQAGSLSRAPRAKDAPRCTSPFKWKINIYTLLREAWVGGWVFNESIAYDEAVH